MKLLVSSAAGELAEVIRVIVEKGERRGDRR